MRDLAEVPAVQRERTHGVNIYRPHTTTKPRAGIDWTALTPTCKSCGQKSGQLNRDSVCPACRAPGLPTEEKPGKPAPRSSAPRQRPASSTPRRARGAGPSTARKKRPARRETRPTRAGRPGRQPRELDEQGIVEAYRDGASPPKIAEQYGIGAKRVRSILDRRGIERRDDRALNSGGRPRKYDDQVRADVARLYVDEKLSRTQVAERLGIPYKSVVTIMRHDGIEAREGQSGRADGAVELKAQMQRLGVSSREVKAWAFRHGLIDRISRGLPSQAVVDAYEAAHGGAA